MGPLNGRLVGALPAVNLVTLVAAVAVLWWRIGSLEETARGLQAAVVALQVEVAGLTVQVNGRP